MIQAAPHFFDTGAQNTVLYNSAAQASFFTTSAVVASPSPSPTPTVSPTSTPSGGQTGPQLFHNYQAPYPYPHNPPPPSAVALLFGEPSIGVDWVSNNTMLQGDLNTWQIKFDYSVKPPPATWNDRSYQWTDTSSLDPRLIVDHTGGARSTGDRTVVDQLAAGNSQQAYSDTDGGTAAPPTNSPDWVPQVGGGIPAPPTTKALGQAAIPRLCPPAPTRPSIPMPSTTAARESC